MNKEYVRANLDNVTKIEPYHTYYQQRNGKISEYISRYLGLPQVSSETVPGQTYEVLASTITKSTAEQLNLNSIDDFYGGVFDHLQHVDKSALHPKLGISPSHYSEQFSNRIIDSVLPGYSFFEIEGAQRAFINLRSRFDSLRLKLPQQSDGHGQFVLDTFEELNFQIKKLDISLLRNFGAVLEPNLLNTQTISVGEFLNSFSFIAHQVNDLGEDGRSRYKGAQVTVFKSKLDDLNVNCINDVLERDAIQKSAQVHEAYSVLNPLLSRISYDLLVGQDKFGQVYSGITDVTSRVGGTCPALMCVVEYLNSHSNIYQANGVVTLDYDPQSQNLPGEDFVNHPTLRITANHLERSPL